MPHNNAPESQPGTKREREDDLLPPPVAPERQASEGTFTAKVSALDVSGVTFGKVHINFERACDQGVKKVSVFILADISGSMTAGSRLGNLKAGLRRFVALSQEYADRVEVELALITFNHTANLVVPMGPIDPEKIRQTIDNLSASGGTDMSTAFGMAMRMARELIEVGKSVHVVMLTDGEDPDFLHALTNKSNRYYSKNEQLIADLKLFPYTTVCCVGICADASKDILNSIVGVCRRATSQIIVEQDIARLFGSVFGLICELVEGNFTVSVGDVKEVPCQPPMECSMFFETADLSSDTVTISFAGRQTVSTPRSEWGPPDAALVVAYAESVKAKSAENAVPFLGRRDFDAATVLMTSTRAKLQDLMHLIPDDAVLAAMIAELTQDIADLADRSTAEAASRMQMLRVISTASTASRTMSIDPDGRSVSDFQRQLSA